MIVLLRTYERMVAAAKESGKPLEGPGSELFWQVKETVKEMQDAGELK